MKLALWEGTGRPDYLDSRPRALSPEPPWRSGSLSTSWRAHALQCLIHRDLGSLPHTGMILDFVQACVFLLFSVFAFYSPPKTNTP